MFQINTIKKLCQKVNYTITDIYKDIDGIRKFNVEAPHGCHFLEGIHERCGMDSVEQLKELIVLGTEKCNEDCEWWEDEDE